MVGLSSSTGGAVVCSFGIYRASHLVAFLFFKAEAYWSLSFFSFLSSRIIVPLSGLSSGNVLTVVFMHHMLISTDWSKYLCLYSKSIHAELPGERSIPNGPFSGIVGSVNITLNIASAMKVTAIPMSKCAPQSFGTLWLLRNWMPDDMLLFFFNRYQCFKSAWVYEVFHSGFSFPASYSNLKTALQVYDKEVQWTLGAILYRTRFLPLR